MEPEPRASEPSDRDLLCRYRGGDRTAFEALYERYARPVYFYLTSLSEDSPLAEDLLQETFLRLLAQTPFRLQDSVRGLVYAIARNLFRDEARRREVRMRALPVLELPASAKAAETAEVLARSLQELPAEQREVVILKFYGALSFPEIAELSECPEPTVKSRYRYAIDKLAEMLKEDNS